MLMHKISEDFGTTESVRFCDLRLVASVTSEAFVGETFVVRKAFGGEAFVGELFAVGEAFVGELFAVGEAFVGEAFVVGETFVGEAFVLKLSLVGTLNWFCFTLLDQECVKLLRIVVELHDEANISEFGIPSDGGSPNSNSRFELAMLESSGPLLESCTKNSRLGDLRNCQALANIGSSSFMSVGVKLPLHPWLQRMLSFIGYAPGQLYPGFWDTLIGFYIIWMEYGLGEPSFHQWRYCYKMRSGKACTGYAECACRSERQRIVFVTRMTIKLSGRELADIEKVLRCPKRIDIWASYDPYFEMEKVGKKWESSAKKGKAPMLVPVYDILFYKGACKHRVRPTPKPKSQEEVLKIVASKNAEAEAIGCVAAIVTGDERRLLPLLPTINPIFPPTMESTDQEGGPSCSRKRKYKEEVCNIHWNDLKVAMQPSSFRYVNNCLVGHRSTVDELGEPLDKNESYHDRMMRLSSYVMTEYDDTLREVERYKAKFKENKQLKTSKALADVIHLKDENFESLKRWNGENVRLKKQLEATKEQLETTILEVSNVKEELDSALVEVSGLKRSIPTERDATVQEFLGEAFVLAVDPSSDDDSDNEACTSEQSQENKDGPGDAEEGDDNNGVETQSDIVRGSASNEDDS
ncbi:unnamed protein product [Malus baccata var. baccata]